MPTRHHGGENVNIVHVRSLTRGQRVVDAVAKTLGSWPFIIGPSLFLMAWIAVNAVAGRSLIWDVYPFILLKLMLSFQAAYSAPFIMMSQNRQALKDRVMSENDYAINQSAAAAINEALDPLEAQDRVMLQQHEEMLARMSELLALQRHTVVAHTGRRNGGARRATVAPQMLDSATGSQVSSAAPPRQPAGQCVRGEHLNPVSARWGERRFERRVSRLKLLPTRVPSWFPGNSRSGAGKKGRVSVQAPEPSRARATRRFRKFRPLGPGHVDHWERDGRKQRANLEDIHLEVDSDALSAPYLTCPHRVIRRPWHFRGQGVLPRPRDSVPGLRAFRRVLHTQTVRSGSSA
jgi:uncharacterized membrane protein